MKIPFTKTLEHELVYARFHRSLFDDVVASVLFVGRGEAEEIAQEVLLEVFLTAEQEKDKPLEDALNERRGLVFVAAKNSALSRIRHHKVQEKYSLNQREAAQGQAASSLESSLIRDKQTALLLDAVNSLPPICRQVFVQRKLHGKTHEQIAQMLGISVKTVENHLVKGLKLCRVYMLNQSQLAKTKQR